MLNVLSCRGIFALNTTVLSTSNRTMSKLTMSRNFLLYLTMTNPSNHV